MGKIKGGGIDICQFVRLSVAAINLRMAVATGAKFEFEVFGWNEWQDFALNFNMNIQKRGLTFLKQFFFFQTRFSQNDVSHIARK